MPNLQTFDKKNMMVGDAVVSIQGGLYSLNDLHRASGGEAKHQPANFLRLDTTQKLIEEITEEISQSSDVRSALRVINGGDQRGTYVCKELVYAYAMWVSAAFNLRVIRAFDAGISAAPALPDFSNPAEAARANQRIAWDKNTHAGAATTAITRKNRNSVLIIVSTCASLLLFLVSWWAAPANPINASTMVATPDAALISGIEALLFQVRLMRATTLCALFTVILSQVHIMRIEGGKDD